MILKNISSIINIFVDSFHSTDYSKWSICIFVFYWNQLIYWFQLPPVDVQISTGTSSCASFNWDQFMYWFQLRPVHVLVSTGTSWCTNFNWDQFMYWFQLAPVHVLQFQLGPVSCACFNWDQLMNWFQLEPVDVLVSTGTSWCTGFNWWYTSMVNGFHMESTGKYSIGFLWVQLESTSIKRSSLVSWVLNWNQLVATQVRPTGFSWYQLV